MIKIETFHHVSVPIANLENSRKFYEQILGLEKIESRPDLGFEGAWYKLDRDRQLHIIVHDRSKSTLRERKKLDPRDVHFAIRVNNYHETLEFLHSKGYQQNANDELYEMKESPKNPTPWQQIYIMDPDRNVIELNVERPHDEA